MKSSKYIFSVVMLAILLIGPAARADLSLNIATNNPPGSRFGLNLMYLWTDWAAEIGGGYVKTGKDDHDRNSTITVGDINLKYLMLAGIFRPYFQVGTALGFSSTGRSATLEVGDGFFGGMGAFLFGTGFYLYGSYNIGQGKAAFGQGGIGFDL